MQESKLRTVCYPFPASQGYKKAQVRWPEAGKPSTPILWNGTSGPLSQSSVLRFRNQFHRFALQGKLRFKSKDYTITQPSCSGVALPVCQRQISTASCRASATNARFFWRVRPWDLTTDVASAGRLTLRLIQDHAPGQFDQCPPHPRVARLGDGQVAVTLTRTAHPAAQAGVTADLLAVFEA